MTAITIGKQGKKDIKLDLNILLRTRLLIQANSGGGKSLTLRGLAEQAFGKVQIIIIDPAGEFSTLRQKFDYVLVGEHGETDANIRTAGMLAERLLELKASAVCDLYGLKQDQRHLWVKNFLEATMNVNKRLWHPVLFIVDEAHKFMPEKGEGESVAKSAMLSLCSDGRKYGFCAIFATQRLAKLDKSGASELLNVLIGPTFIDVDLERAHRALGIIRSDWAAFDAQMKTVDPGNFWALGRAISKQRILVHISMPATTHPEPGSAQAAEPPPAPEKIRALLPKLSDLPKEVERKALTEADLRKQIAELQQQIRARPTVTVPETKIERVEVPVFKAGEIEKLETLANSIDQAGRNLVEPLRGLRTSINDAKILASKPIIVPQRMRENDPVLNREHTSMPARSAPRAPRIDADTDSPLAMGPKKILTACAQFPDGIQRNELTVLTTYKRSTRDTYIQKLSERGLVSARGSMIHITDAGLQALGADFEPLPIGSQLREYWLDRLPEGEKRILQILIMSYPNDVNRKDIDDATGYKRSTRDTYLQKMKSKRIVEDVGAARVRAAASLFD